MILAAPNSIALASNEDLHISADGQLSHSAGDSINLSTQKSLIGHASSKVSLFAAQEGARLYAGKGKIEIQAQGDGADLIARKGIQIISTEDVIEFKSPKEIVLTAGGSQIKINSSGIFSTTGAKFEVKAGQHIFQGGKAAGVDINGLPTLEVYNERFLMKWPSGDPLSNVDYKISSKGNSFIAQSDKKGFTKEIHTANEENLLLDLVWMEDLEVDPIHGEDEE